MTISLFPEPDSGENRNLANKPTLKKLSVQSIFNYKNDFERYFNDHFGFRNVLTRLNSVVHFRLAGISTNDRVIVGEKNWLFYNDPYDGVSLKDYFGESNFTEDEIRQIKNKVVHLNERLKAKNIHFMIVVVPNKHTIYQEYLPSYVSRKKGMITRADQLHECLRASGVDLVDLREKMRSSKRGSTYPLYYLTDTHWNSLGAFIGYDEIIMHLRRKYPEINAQKLSDFSVSLGENRNGDLAGFMNIKGLIFDPEINVVPKTPRQSRPANVAYKSMAGMTSVASQVSNTNLPKIVMFRDSFAEHLIPYMSESFSRSVYIWKQTIDIAIIEQEKPDVVIFETVERYLGTLLNIN
jgi:hypothetical protein